MSSEILLSSSIIKAPKRKFKTPLIFPSKLNLNQRKVEQKENELLNDVHSFSVSSSLSTKGSDSFLKNFYLVLYFTQFYLLLLISQIIYRLIDIHFKHIHIVLYLINRLSG